MGETVQRAFAGTSRAIVFFVFPRPAPAQVSPEGAGVSRPPFH